MLDCAGSGLPSAAGAPVAMGDSVQEGRKCMLSQSSTSRLEGRSPVSSSLGKAIPGSRRILDPLEHSTLGVHCQVQEVVSASLQPGHCSSAESPGPHRLAPVREESLQNLLTKMPVFL